MGIIKSAATNTLFPTAFVMLANQLKDKFSHLKDATTDQYQEIAKTYLQSTWKGMSLENAAYVGNEVKEFGHSLYESARHLQPKGHVHSFISTATDQRQELALIAGFGLATTILDAGMKKVPGINKYGVVRLPISFGIATAALYFGTNLITGENSLELMKSVALKASFVGLFWFAGAKTIEYTARGSGSVSYIVFEKTGKAFAIVSKGFFNAIAYGANKASIFSLPEGKPSEKSEDKEVQEQKEKDAQQILDIFKSDGFNSKRQDDLKSPVGSPRKKESDDKDLKSPVGSPRKKASDDEDLKSPVGSPRKKESDDEDLKSPVGSPRKKESDDEDLKSPVGSPRKKASDDEDLKSPVGSPRKSESDDKDLKSPVASPRKKASDDEELTSPALSPKTVKKGPIVIDAIGEIGSVGRSNSPLEKTLSKNSTGSAAKKLNFEEEEK